MLHFAPWKLAVIFLTVLLGFVFAIPNVLPEAVRANLPAWAPKRPINLGLDLRGGSYLLLEVDVDALGKQRVKDLSEELTAALARSPRIGFSARAADDNSVSVQLRDPSDADEALKRARDLAQTIGGQVGGIGGRPDLSAAMDGDRLVLTLTPEALQLKARAALDQTMEIVRKRIDEFGTLEASVQRQGANRIVVQAPGASDPAQLAASLAKTAQMTFQLVDLTARAEDIQAGFAPPGSEIVPSDDGFTPFMAVKRRAIVTGENLIDAQPGFDQNNRAIVNFRFDQPGARAFGRTTIDNVGKPFAILLDGRVISAPTINEPITGGSGQISGNFTPESAAELAALLCAGALPAPLAVVESRTVGAELGADSIRAGWIAAIVSFVGILIFMLVFYGILGLMANVGLIINLVLLMGALSGMGAALTLPGIAGIILTMGMAVDANVLIFERLREELRAGRTPVVATNAAFERATLTIMDANITTLIAAAFLFQFGSGPVRGFAVTLGLGIFTSVFCGVWLGRWMLATWLRAARPKRLGLVKAAAGAA